MVFRTARTYTAEERRGAAAEVSAEVSGTSADTSFRGPVRAGHPSEDPAEKSRREEPQRRAAEKCRREVPQRSAAEKSRREEPQRSARHFSAAAPVLEAGHGVVRGEVGDVIVGPVAQPRMTVASRGTGVSGGRVGWGRVGPAAVPRHGVHGAVGRQCHVGRPVNARRVQPACVQPACVQPACVRIGGGRAVVTSRETRGQHRHGRGECHPAAPAASPRRRGAPPRRTEIGQTRQRQTRRRPWAQ